MKRSVSILLVGLIAIGAVPACGSEDDDAAPACEACAHQRYQCTSPGVETRDFVVERQEADGCSGPVGFSGQRWRIVCDESLLCTAPDHCVPIDLGTDGFDLGMTECYAKL